MQRKNKAGKRERVRERKREREKEREIQRGCELKIESFEEKEIAQWQTHIFAEIFLLILSTFTILPSF